MTAATAGTATAEVVAPEVVAARLGEAGKMVRMIAITIAAGATAVMEAEE